MDYTTILYEADDRVARITLNRPKKMNAFSIRLCNEFRDAIAKADQDPDVRVVLVSSAGGRAFSAGFDMNDEDVVPPKDGKRGIDYWKKAMDGTFQFHTSVFECSKPVIG